jgi:hypothetical protein
MRKLYLMVFFTVVALAMASAAALAQTKSLKIVNQRSSGFPIVYVYITPAGDETWGQDQLGGHVIGAGESYSWTIPWDGCYVDAMAKTFLGLKAEHRAINVCGGMTWTLYDSDDSK